MVPVTYDEIGFHANVLRDVQNGQTRTNAIRTQQVSNLLRLRGNGISRRQHR